MMASLIDRKQLKQDMKDLLADAQVSPRSMTVLYLGLSLVLSMVDTLAGNSGLLSTFLTILTSLLGMVLSAGFVLYCMAIRRGERAEFLTLFDGFSFVGKLIGLNIVMYFFITLWSMLFVVPGIIAAYRYRFALYNLYENPGISVFEALNMSKRQTYGYKSQLFMLDLSYLGWTLLASAPSLLYGSLLSQETLIEAMDTVGFGTIAFTTGSLSTAALPVWGWTLLMGLWQLAVAIFYLPTYQCVELGYFEIAKSTSGVGEGASPNRQDTWRNGPDDMGGF
ncbi:DUF975 family protein [Oscillibacter valericigenes]|uniref:DUF975 family protein n=1 Tax=Oscillibacter valericigenes TaxID=351091 RepID=UPI001F3ED6F1|nr:DUF975 family protein [Oscillibacter valericigenes]MCF2662988.1 DUF975 family protein [Oscillibacter valericigenes]